MGLSRAKLPSLQVRLRASGAASRGCWLERAPTSWSTTTPMPPVRTPPSVRSLKWAERPSSFRPTFRIPKFVPFLGAVGCILIMFLINAIFSLVALVVVIVLYVWLARRGLKADWGDIRGGIYLVMANTPADKEDIQRPGSSHGNSKIVNPDGNVLVEAGFFTEEIVVADLDLSKASCGIARRSTREETVLQEWLQAGLKFVVRVP